MVVIGNSMIFVLFLVGAYWLLTWLWEIGVEEVVVYTQGFLKSEAQKVRVQVLPEVNSKKAWDKLELLLYYSSIRNRIPFLSAKVYVILLFVLVCIVFVLGMIFSYSVWKSVFLSVGAVLVIFQCLEVMRRINRRSTERHLLELLNLTESFTATGDEALAILKACSPYMKGPIGQALGSIERYLLKGWSASMVLARLKVSLEHAKWQEFMHNLHVCSMYNSDFSYVFRSSRKSIQSYLTSQKERQGIKNTARMEMLAIAVLCLIIIVVLSNFLQITVENLLWGSAIGKGCTLYMVGIMLLFFWKMGDYEKE